jgi:predicted ATP-grasp superfamily ATP-dependent carboligase
MSAKSTSLLILANSGRAIAESAHRGGYRITVLDGYSDQDTQAVADCWPVTQGFANLNVDIFTQEIASIIPEHPCGVVYGAGLEEATPLLKRLSTCCHLLGNDPSVLELLRRPRRFFSLLDRLGIPHPEVSFMAPNSAPSGRHWLIKKAGSCGGQGVAYFSADYAVTDPACYYQKHIPGRVMSVLFIANGTRHRTIGYNLLGISRPKTPAPFLYSGAIGQLSLPDAARHQVEAVVDQLVCDLGLQGINSLDFISNEAGIFVIDINPRPTATLELYEHIVPEGWIKQHIQACHGELPIGPVVDSAMMHGHQILYASRSLEIPGEMAWPQWVKDRPRCGSIITQGQPICSLFAEGSTSLEVETALHRRRDEIVQMLDSVCYQPLLRKVAV